VSLIAATAIGGVTISPSTTPKIALNRTNSPTLMSP
jgi:hypothetical protein